MTSFPVYPAGCNFARTAASFASSNFLRLTVRSGPGSTRAQIEHAASNQALERGGIRAPPFSLMLEFLPAAGGGFC
jgi:hypothetical protein